MIKIITLTLIFFLKITSLQPNEKNKIRKRLKADKNFSCLSCYDKYSITKKVNGLPLIHFNQTREALQLAKFYLPQNPIIFEAGAFEGKDTTYMSKFFNNSKIHAFEPVPEAYEKLIANTKEFTNIFTYQVAISDFAGSAKFHVSETMDNAGKCMPLSSYSSSLLNPKEHLIHASYVFFNKDIEVTTDTIDSWAVKNNITKIDFMWLDMQGCELNALKASPQILKTVKVILTEVEFVEAYENQYLYWDIKKWLEAQGFTMIATNFEVPPKLPRWFGDALFVRISG